MNNWRERFNLFYYNIFRFERYTQFIVSHPMHVFVSLTGLGKTLAKRIRREDWDEYILSVLNDPKGGMSLHFTGMQITAHLTVLLITPWNIICGLIYIKIDPWFYGSIVAVILAVVISHYAAPSDTRKYLKDFERFESMPKTWKRKSALLTFLIVTGIWAMFIASFIFNLRSSIS